MKFTFALALIAASLASAAPAVELDKRTTLAGFDVSAYQPNVNMKTAASNGAKFVYIKATEGTTYTNPDFSAQYDGATSAGLVRGSYHFAHPGDSSGTAQADYFVKHGGGWSADGITLPGAIDLEGDCGGLSQSGMVTWIKDFTKEYKAKTGRAPAIYTTTSWWTTCTGNSAAFSANPLCIAHWSSSVGTLPASWSTWKVWQNADSGVNPGDSDKFNGAASALTKFAKNT